MTRTLKRPSAARLTFQFAAAGALVSLIAGGCSSDIETVTVEECAGVPASGGHTSASAAGHGNPIGGSASPSETAGEAGIGQSGESSGAASGNGGSSAGGSSGSLIVSGNGGTSGSGGIGNGGGSAGRSGGGSGGKGSGGSGGKSSGGSGGKSSGGSANVGGASGSAAAVCGDATVTPPEFCDAGKDEFGNKNTDLSYGCYACTTLAPAIAGNTQQCDACLGGANKPMRCYACQDHRPCYSCLRLQPDDSKIANSPTCTNNVNPDTNPDPEKDLEYPFTPKGYSDFCFDPTNDNYKTATQGPAGSTPRGRVCQALVECILRTGCALGKGTTIFSNCYCGVEPQKNACSADPDFVPNGPCVKEIIDADSPGPSLTGPALALDIATNLGQVDDYGKRSIALAIAYHLMTCAADPLGCADECFGSSNGSSGAGGTSGTGGKAGSGGKGSGG